MSPVEDQPDSPGYDGLEGALANCRIAPVAGHVPRGKAILQKVQGKGTSATLDWRVSVTLLLILVAGLPICRAVARAAWELAASAFAAVTPPLVSGFCLSGLSRLE